LIPKGEKYGIKATMGQIWGISSGQARFGVQEIQQINPTPNSKFWEKERGETMDLGGGQGQYWMMVSIQASVRGSICQFLQIYACFDCVVINHQKGGDCKEHGSIRP
jgi:hypothetical protein